MFGEQIVLDAIQVYSRSPDHHFWKDLNHVIRMMNDKMATALGHDSAYVSLQGITDFDHRCKASELAEEFIKEDNIILSTLKPISMLDFYITADNHLNAAYVRKSPIFDDEGLVKGISGTAIDATTCPLMRSTLIFVSEDALYRNKTNNNFNQRSYHLKSTYDNFSLSPRESETLFYMIRGKTAKEIGLRLNIRCNTVQKYQEEIKYKMNCQTRSQIIEKAINSGAALVLLKSLLGIGRVSS